MQYPTMQEIQVLTQQVRTRTSFQPTVGMILGSGLGGMADAVQADAVIPTKDLEGWPVSTVEGHVGELVLGDLEGQAVMVLRGRVHFYEGYDMPQIGLSVRVMHQLGAETLIVTNAAGAVNPDYEPGDLMLIRDHINLMGMAGQNPLRGPNLDAIGPRFPDMSQVYDRKLAQDAREVAREAGFVLHEGVYICLAGPTFETPADLRFLRMVGVDAVGMSTVPEAIIARHSGMRVLGISGISNKANLDGNTETTHEEVLEAGKVIVPKLTELIKGILRKL